MDCPSCGRANTEGDTYCSSCGNALSSGAPSGRSVPPMEPGAVAPPQPTASTVARASLWLGIISLAASVLVSVALEIETGYFLWTRVPPHVVPEGFWGDLYEIIERIPDPIMDLVFQAGLILFFLVVGSPPLGLIFGFFGLSQERKQPTRRGRTYCISGIVLSALALLGFATYLLFLIFY